MALDHCVIPKNLLIRNIKYMIHILHAQQKHENSTGISKD
jgi:hypothetical protein